MTKAQIQACHPVLMVSDVEASIQYYAHLGFDCVFGGATDSPNYAGLRRDNVELHLQWQSEEQWKYDMDRPTYRFVVDDVDALYSEFQDCSVALQITDVMNSGWGTREFHVRDPDGNGLQFYRDR